MPQTDTTTGITDSSSLNETGSLEPPVEETATGGGDSAIGAAIVALTAAVEQLTAAVAALTGTAGGGDVGQTGACGMPGCTMPDCGSTMGGGGTGASQASTGASNVNVIPDTGAVDPATGEIIITPDDGAQPNEPTDGTDIDATEVPVEDEIPAEEQTEEPVSTPGVDPNSPTGNPF